MNVFCTQIHVHLHVEASYMTNKDRNLVGNVQKLELGWKCAHFQRQQAYANN